jgi:hypothetical protein
LATAPRPASIRSWLVAYFRRYAGFEPGKRRRDKAILPPAITIVQQYFALTALCYNRRMTETNKDKLIRQYAAGEITWSTTRERGIDNYVEVLAGLGRLGLRVPVAPMEGPNREARERGRAMLREWLKPSR